MGSLISSEIREIFLVYGMGLSKWIEAFNLFPSSKIL